MTATTNQRVSEMAEAIQPGDLARLDIEDPVELAKACRVRHGNMVAACNALAKRHSALKRELASAWSERVGAMAAGSRTVFLDEASRGELAALVRTRCEFAALTAEIADVRHAIELADNETRRAERALQSGAPQL